MGLPTREEAKNIFEYYEQIGCFRERDEDNVKVIVSAYSSGTLIEARTEGEIIDELKKIIVTPKFNRQLFVSIAHALVGKV
jgi:hypothetical protein